MSIRDLLEGLGQAVDAGLAERGRWIPVDGAPLLENVPVQVDEMDEVGQGFGGRDGPILRSVMLQVRRVHVADPRRDDQVELEGGERFVITADPLIDRDGFWTCPARRVG